MTEKQPIPKIKIKPVQFVVIPEEEVKEMTSKAIKEWHCERVEVGVKLVAGKYEPNNPKHIKPSDIIGICYQCTQNKRISKTSRNKLKNLRRR